MKLPSTVVTVIVASPAPTACTTPASDTVAIASLDEDQVTFLFVASAGATVAVRVMSASPTARESVLGDTVTPVTATVAALTVTAHVAVKLPSTVVTVIVALPAPTAVTSPVADTVATVSSDEDQVTLLFVASSGATVAVNSKAAPPTVIEPVVGDTVTPVTGVLDAIWTESGV